MFASLSTRKRDESGVVAILVAALAVIILMFAAYAVDIGMQVNRKHQLAATLDSAAQAGASELPGNSNVARTTALNFAKVHDPTATGDEEPTIDFWCIVAAVGTTAPYSVDTTQVPATCNPGTGPYTPGVNYKTTNRKISCSPILCAIPCVEPANNNGTPKIACNTIRVYQGRDVPFTFARAGGIQQGSTGTVMSVACKGSCGTISPNPLDVAVIADRTLSMREQDVADMITGIEGMLEQMTPSQQYVALGAIARSKPTSTGQSGSCDSQQLTYPAASGTTGKWLPISFSNNYVASNQRVNTNSALIKGVRCLTNQSSATYGTALAAPMKAAARYLLGLDTNNLGSLPTRELPPQKMIIFETDGQPNESQATAGSTDLNSSSDVFSNTDRTTGPIVRDPDGATETTYSGSGNNRIKYVTRQVSRTYTYVGGNIACQNLIDVAANAKARNILVVMIGYNMANKRCNDYDPNPSQSSNTVQTSTADGGKTIYRTETTTKYVASPTTSSVLNVMAQAASPANGIQSVAESDCSSVAERTAENSDGDYLFCGATGTDMAPIFKTALSQASKGIKLMKLP